MGAEKYAQRPMGRGRMIGLNAECEHLLQCRSGSVRPRAPAGRLTAVDERQRGMLRPSDEPIGVGRVVEKCDAEGHRAVAKNTARHCEQLATMGEFGNRTEGKDMPRSCPAALPFG